MPRPVREIEAFFEATGPYAVSRPYAENMYRTSIGLISRYTGPIAVRAVTGVNLPLKGSTIDPTKIRLGKTPHKALLTRRDIEAGGNSLVAGGRTIGEMDGNRLINSLATTRVIEPAYSMNHEVTLTSSIHEFAHTFGLEHCVGAACVMSATLESRSDAQNLLNSGQLFCEPCAEDLEVASMSELARQL